MGRLLLFSLSRAEDGTMRSLKLGVEERAAIKILTEDCLQHTSLLISEASLQSHGLSDLGPDGKPTKISNFDLSFSRILQKLMSFFLLVLQPKPLLEAFSRSGKPLPPRLWRLKCLAKRGRARRGNPLSSRRFQPSLLHGPCPSRRTQVHMLWSGDFSKRILWLEIPGRLLNGPGM